MTRRTVLFCATLSLILGKAWLGGSPAYGCMFCEDRTVRIFGVAIGGVLEICRSATNGEEGTTQCGETVVQGNSFCNETGTFCTVITAGGGSGPGGGYGGECTIDAAALCPPSCGACHRV